MTNIGVKQISIRLLPDGFSFLNQFHPILPGADFNKRLQETMIDNLTTIEEDTSIEKCSVENTRFCITPIDTPAPLAEQMYAVTLPEPEQEEIKLQLKDENAEILFTFGINSEIYHFILRNWPGIHFTHPLFELYRQWAGRQEISSDCMIAEAEDKYLNLLIFKEGKLQLANRFEDEGSNNLLYHLMNCWEQCGLDVIDDRLYLSTQDEELRRNIRQYIKLCES